MKKIPTIFERDWSGNRSLVTNIPNPKTDWVFKGQGRSKRKLDGTCCAFIDGIFVKRREVSKGETIQDWFILTDNDEETGKKVGWVPVIDCPEDKYHLEALESFLFSYDYVKNNVPDMTCELVGPKIQGNPEKEELHLLSPHTQFALDMENVPTDFDALKQYLQGKDIEGIVWHHDDGRMGKIKKRDFGFKR